MQQPNEPATEQQLAFLEQHGQSSQRSLTRGEAAELIRKLREQLWPRETEQQPTGAKAAYSLGLAFETSKHLQSNSDAPEGEFAQLCVKRREFWLDTCREATQMHAASQQVFELYQMHGCRFASPTDEEVQEVLSALDSAMPAWELNHPELFYHTLQLNFPELLKQPLAMGS